MLILDLEPSTHDEIIYCADTTIDTCGYLEGEDQCDCSVNTFGDSDQDVESDDDQADDNYGGKYLLDDQLKIREKYN